MKARAKKVLFHFVKENLNSLTRQLLSAYHLNLPVNEYLYVCALPKAWHYQVFGYSYLYCNPGNWLQSLPSTRPVYQLEYYRTKYRIQDSGYLLCHIR